MTTAQDAVQQVADLLYARGTPCDFGIDELSLPEIIETTRSRFPNKSISAVKNWAWWDYDISESDRKHFVANGVQPAIIFANYLIWDSRGRWPEGSNVKTTPLVNFEENCLFITRNTVYIIVGKGQRKTVNPHHASSLYF